MSNLRLFLLAASLAALTSPVAAQFVPSRDSLADVYPGKAYSPYAQRKFPDRVYWGDTHLHTGLSVDAGLFGARLGLDEAYRFARLFLLSLLSIYMNQTPLSVQVIKQ